jgi:hypothetical protein
LTACGIAPRAKKRRQRFSPEVARELQEEHAACLAADGEGRQTPHLFNEVHKLLAKALEVEQLARRQNNTEGNLLRGIVAMTRMAAGFAVKADALRADGYSEAGTQTHPGWAPAAGASDGSSELRIKIAKAEQDPARLAELVAAPWPKQAFTSTKLVRVSIQSERAVRVLVVRAGDQKDQERVKLLASQFVGLSQGKVVRELKPGGLAVLKTASSIFLEDGSEVEQAPPRTLIIGKLSGPSEVSDDQEIISLYQRIAAEAIRRKHDEVLVQPSEADDLEKIRRVLECCTISVPIKVEICSKGHKVPATAGEKRFAGAKRTDLDNTIVLGTSGRSFADTVKSLKERLCPEKDGVSLRSVSMTANGGVKLQIRETRAGGKKAFSKNLEGAAADLKVEVKEVTRTTPVVLRNLDASVDMDEIRQALALAGVELKAPLRISLGEPREGRLRGRMAIVRLPRPDALKLLRLGTMVVGWSKCRATIAPYDEPTVCYRCQLFGHTVAACKAPKAETRRRCYRCGGNDHIAKDCTADPVCYSCGAEGHRADSIRCPRIRGSAQAKNGGILPPKPPSGAPNRRRRQGAKEVKDFGEAEEAVDAPKMQHPEDGPKVTPVQQ